MQRRRVERGIYRQPNGKYAVCFTLAGRLRSVASPATSTRPGARFHLRMVKEGSEMDYRLPYEIVEVVEPELPVPSHEPMPEVALHNGTVTPHRARRRGGKTRLILTDGRYAEECGSGAAAGWESSFDQLEALRGGSA